MTGIKLGIREVERRMKRLAAVQKREEKRKERVRMKKIMRAAGLALGLTLAALSAAGCGQEQAAGALEEQTAGTLEEHAAGALEERAAGAMEDRAAEALEEQAAGVLEERAAGALEEQAAGALEEQTAGALEKQPAGALEAQADGSRETAAGTEAETASEIYNEITQNVGLTAPVIMTDSFLTNYYGIDPDMLEEFIFSISEEATSAETVAIMKVKEEADAEVIAAALQVVVEEKRGEMEHYLPEQFAIVDRSAVKTCGPYVWLVISENETSISSIIDENLRGVQEYA